MTDIFTAISIYRFAADGRLIYEGYFYNDLYHGRGTLYGDNGEYYEGEWVGDEKNGFGEMDFINGDRYVGDWKNGIIEGKGKMIFSNGDTFEGNWLKNQRHGEGTQTFTTGEQYIGNWNQGIRSGKGAQIYLNGDNYVGNLNTNEWKNLIDQNLTLNWYILKKTEVFLQKSKKYLLDEGFSIIVPVYYNTWDRDKTIKHWWPDETEEYKNTIVKIGKDFKRVIDYLETRENLDIKSLSYMGYSWGSVTSNILLAIKLLPDPNDSWVHLTLTNQAV